MSDDPSKIKDIDLEIFKEDISECKHATGTTVLITDCCSYLKRLCAASRYFDILNASNLVEDKKKELFVEFMETVYDSVLDDTAHLLKRHAGDVQQIWREWTERYGFPNCSVSKCAKTARHYGRGRRDKMKMKNNGQENDDIFAHHQSHFDRLHNFVAHLYDTGLRVDIAALLEKEQESKTDDNLDISMTDKQFAAERDCIKMRREECQMDMDRLENENNKFTIQAATAKTKVTLTDALFTKLSQTENVEKDVIRLKEYLERNKFDSDGIAFDLEDAQDSNITNIVANEQAIEAMTSFIRSVELRRKAFSTGIVFDYWTEGQPMSIKAKYENLKEEIIESGYLTPAKWRKFVEMKAKRYLKMKKVKKMKSGTAYMSDRHKTNTGHLEKGQPITYEHLCAVILYCDFGILCTAFSATYRRENVFEDLESVKARHSEFGHFGKSLVETVVDFGINRIEWPIYQGADPKPDGFETANGPYFCGINCKLNIGSYAIRLFGPCSTTTVRSVALNFAKSNGIILRLNNAGTESMNQCLFDCSWISNYFEESERLWIAGKYPLRIESIVIVKSAKNYKNIIRVLFAFDSMISGVKTDHDKVILNEYDLNLISKLFELRLNGGNAISHEFDAYMVDEWDLFRENKKEIRLNLSEIYSEFKSLSKLILFNVVCSMWDTVKGMDNVLKGEWISLFPTVHTVRISTFGVYYKFRLEALLETMKSLSPSVTVIVEDRVYVRKWAKKALTDEVSAAFKAEGWNMEYDDKHIGFMYGYKGGLIIKSAE